MKILAIESSSKRFGLAISEGPKVLKNRSVVLRKVLSSSIIPAIAKILKDTRISFSQLDALVIGLGPGSFTSLRVGLATVKGLAFAGAKPIVGLSSLDAIAFQTKKIKLRPSNICVLVDAKRQLTYAAFYEMVNQQLVRKSDYFLLPIAEILAKIKEDTLLAGDAVALYQKEMALWKKQKSREGIKIHFAPEKLWYPEAKALIALALERVTEKKFDPIDKVLPYYLYPDHCQVQK